MVRTPVTEQRKEGPCKTAHAHRNEACLLCKQRGHRRASCPNLEKRKVASQVLPVVPKIQITTSMTSRGGKAHNAVPSNGNKPGEQSQSWITVGKRVRGKLACNAVHSNDNKTVGQSPHVTQKMVLDRFKEWFKKQARAGLLEPRMKKEPEFVHLYQKPITTQKIIKYLHQRGSQPV